MTLKNTDKKNVQIFMKTLQEDEVSDHSYKGTYQIKNDNKYLIYNDGFEQCSVICDKSTVRLRRFKSGSVMTFEKNAEHISSYMTPMGNLPLSVVTDVIEDRLEQNGTLLLEYSISIGETKPVKNKINITIKEI